MNKYCIRFKNIFCCAFIGYCLKLDFCKPQTQPLVGEVSKIDDLNAKQLNLCLCMD